MLIQKWNAARVYGFGHYDTNYVFTKLPYLSTQYCNQLNNMLV